jgi:protein transport protein SEC61 subunit gamma-like protein
MLPLIDGVMSTAERKISDIFQTLRLAKKTSREDYFQHLRLVALGLFTVGGIAFVIKLIAEYVTTGSSGRFG